MSSFNAVINTNPSLNGADVVDPNFALEQNEMSLAAMEQQLASARAREAFLAKQVEDANANFEIANQARLAAEEAAASNSNSSSNSDVLNHFNNVNRDSAIFNKQLEELNKKYEEVKNIAREGRKKGEVAKHSKPQIKRSIGFIFDIKFGIEDLKELMNKLIDSQLKGEVVDGDCLISVKDRIDEMESIVNCEMEANEIASASRFGWGTVKYFENYSVFKDQEDAEKKSQRFHQAEGKARANYSNRSRGRGIRGRGRFTPYNVPNSSNSNNVNNSSNNFNNGNFYDKRKQANAETVCFKCNLKGHMRADCPKN